MANYTQISHVDPGTDLTSADFANTARVGMGGTTWLKTVGSLPSSNVNLYRPGPSGSYFAREFTPIDFSMQPGRASREQIIYSYDFAAPAAYGPFYTSSAGTGASSATYGPTIDTSPFGLAIMSTGTTTSGSTWLGTSTSFYTAGTAARLSVEAVYAIPVFSTAGTEEFAHIIGISSTTTSLTNVVGFRVDTAGATARVINGGTTSGTPLTALTTTANTRYRVRVEHFYSGGAYQAKFYMRAEPSYVSPREWPWVAGDVIGTLTDGVNGVTFPTGAYGAGTVLRKLAGSTARTALIQQLIVSTGF